MKTTPTNDDMSPEMQNLVSEMRKMGLEPQKLDPKAIGLDKRPSRFAVWWERPLRCKLGFHVFSWGEWEGAPGSGLVDFFCLRCQKRIRQLPVDDIPHEHRGEPLHWIQLAGKAQRDARTNERAD